MRVLIIEDEAVLRFTFQQFLEEDSYDVATADDYNAGLKYLEQNEVDVIVTDIILGGKSGVDLLRTVNQRGLRCPVVMITGEPNVETAAEAVRLGAFDYLSKPVTGGALKRVVRLAADRKKLADERDSYAGRMDELRRDLAAIFNSVSDGIITVDADMRVRQTNEAARRIFGLRREIAGQLFSEVFPGKLDAAQTALAETLATRKGVDGQRVELEPEGAKVIVITTTPLIGEGGAFSGAVLMIRDITRLTSLEKQVEETQRYRDMIGKGARIQQIFKLVKDLAETDSTALICGESGTGKELIAAALHYASPRATGPFIKVNCSALSEDILESELFGHVKGAFTGAVKDRIGRFEAAHGGTILLDEIGDITPRIQLRLLRVVQEREFERVGESRPIKTNVRVIASTNQDLEDKIRAGEFRQDLYYRLNVVRIDLPPLRERREDLPLLVDHFCRHFNHLLKKEISGVADETMDVFMRYPWYGNVRELENCLERAFIVCHDSHILPTHLPPEILNFSETVTIRPSPKPVGKGSLERERIFAALAQTDWNIAKTARILGIARNTLYQQMKNLGLQRPSEI
ncbi:MAG: sigma 54-interacting transcriptional regulator [Candidatus Hydrogenedentes bacterium]|nr:sigma 54-interacting transcriptional regulator [Candidatus Hydrogenedentota bacterium]